MAEPRHLTRAPITEALIDLRVALPPESVRTLKELAESISGRFPKQETIQHGTVKFQLLPTPNAEKLAGGILGYICSSPDETKRVQFRGDGFTFNRLKPYEDWERMRDEARELWDSYYHHVASSVPINRVGVRYINHLELPLRVELGEFLAMPPSIPQRLPQTIAGFLNRIMVFSEEWKAFALITQNLQPPFKDGAATLLFDIDVFRENVKMSPEEAWKLLEDLHKFKNEVFFESVTERTLEMYA